MGGLVRVSNWAYMAGFLDGDGSIGIEYRKSNPVFRLNWLQSEPNDLVLREMKLWLDDIYINSYLATRENNSIKTSNKMSWLRVYNKRDVKTVLECLFPYLICKAPKAIQVLRLLGTTSSFRPLPIDWDYLAGFTDADGHIATSDNRGYRQYKIGWTQKEDDSYVLDEIIEFLQLNNISCTNSIIKNPEFVNSRTRQIRASQKHTRFILEKMYPYLIVKAKKAKEAIEYLSDIERQKEQYGWNYRKNKAQLQEARKGVLI